jgi:hypothetical protein
MIDETAIRLRYEALGPVLDERGRRRFASAEALAAGRGGVSAVARITGIAPSMIDRGLAELRCETELSPVRLRRAGGGRKRATVKDHTLLGDLKVLVEPMTRGDPTTPLLWTAKSLRNLSAGLAECRPLAARPPPMRRRPRRSPTACRERRLRERASMFSDR